MLTNSTFRHTDIFYSADKDVDLGKGEIFQNKDSRRQLRSVDRFHTDHSPDYFYHREQNQTSHIRLDKSVDQPRFNLPNAPQRKDVFKIVMEESEIQQNHYQRTNPITANISWKDHDSIKNRNINQDNQYSKQRYKNASIFSQYTPQSLKGDKITTHIMQCQKQIKEFEGINPNYTYNVSSIQQLVAKAKLYDEKKWNNGQMQKWRKQYYK